MFSPLFVFNFTFPCIKICRKNYIKITYRKICNQCGSLPQCKFMCFSILLVTCHVVQSNSLSLKDDIVVSAEMCSETILWHLNEQREQ